MAETTKIKSPLRARWVAESQIWLIKADIEHSDWPAFCMRPDCQQMINKVADFIRRLNERNGKHGFYRRHF